MLKDIITSEVRIKILKELFCNLGNPLHIREITRRVGTEINAVRRELKRLNKAGLLHREARMNRVYFTVKKDYPLYHELLAMVYKEEGLGGLIIKNLSELGKVKFAVLSSAFVEGRVSTAKQIDLLLVGVVDMKFLQEMIAGQEEKLGREINYTVLGEEEFFFRKKRRDPFVWDILVQGRIILVGDEDKYCGVK